MPEEKISIVLNSTASGEGIKATVSGLGQVKSAIEAVGIKVAAMQVAFNAALNGFIRGARELAAFTKETIDNTDATGKMAIKIGIATEAFSKLSFATKINEVETEKLQQGFKAFSLWLEKTGQQGGDFTEQLIAQSEAFSKMTNPTTRAAEAVARFGKAGLDMLPLLLNGPADLRKMIVEAERLGVVTDEQAKAADTYNDSLFSLKTAIQSVLREAIFPFIQGMTDSVKWLTDTAVAARKFATNFGALAHVIVDSWKDGKFPEMIGLLIEAGFELGINAVKETWTLFVNAIASFTGSKIGAAILNGVLTFGVRIAQALINAFALPITTLIAGFDYAADHGYSVFLQMFNKLGGPLDKFFKMMGIPGKPSEILSSDYTPKTWQQSMDSASNKTAGISVGATGFLDEQLRASQAILGFDKITIEVDNKRVTALGKLNDLIAQYNNEQLRLRAFGRENLIAGKMEETTGQIKKTLLDAEEASKARILEIQERIANVEGDFNLPQAGKFQMKKRALEEELEIYQKLYDVQTKLINTPGIDDTTRNGFVSSRDQTSKSMTGVRKQRAGMGADPNSVSEQITSAMVKLQDQWGTMAEQMGRAFSDAMGAAFSSISSGLQGLIKGTMTWGKALTNIGTGVVDSIIKSFSDMVASWVTSHIIMKGVALAWDALTSALGWKKVAESNAQELAKKPALFSSALLNSIGSWGTAAIVGVAALVAALSMGAFEKGGVVSGGEQVIRVNENGTESVLNAQATAGLGHGLINSLNNGLIDASALRNMITGAASYASQIAPGVASLDGRVAAGLSVPRPSVVYSGGSAGGSVGAQSGGGNSQPIVVHMILVDSRNSQAARDHNASAGGQAQIVEIVKNHKMEIGIKT